MPKFHFNVVTFYVPDSELPYVVEAQLEGSQDPPIVRFYATEEERNWAVARLEEMSESA